MPNEYEMFFDLLDRIINERPPAPASTLSWQERKAEILESATERDMTNLAEFTSWFGDEDFV